MNLPVDDNSENQEELNAVVGGFSQVELILTQGGGTHGNGI